MLGGDRTLTALTMAPNPGPTNTPLSTPSLGGVSFEHPRDPFDRTPPPVQIPSGVSVMDFVQGTNSSLSAMHLLFKSEAERSEALVFQFAQLGVPQQVFRWTGWAGNIGEHGKGLATVYEAFKGLNGFHMFGGTQIRKLSDLSLIPSTGDIPVALKKAAVVENNPHFVLIGIIPKVAEEPRLVPGLGLVLQVQKDMAPDKQPEFLTTINSDQNIGVVLQPDVNGTYNWIDEARESLRQSSRLADKGWSTNLIVYGGSATAEGARTLSTVEQELTWWAEASVRNPNKPYNILLIRGSGGVADKYASNESWLAEHPAVRVVDIDTHSIRSALKQMSGVRTDFKEV